MTVPLPVVVVTSFEVNWVKCYLGEPELRLLRPLVEETVIGGMRGGWVISSYPLHYAVLGSTVADLERIMYRIFFVATLGFTLTLSPVLIFDGAADAKGGEGASSGGSSSGNGKGKSGQSGSSNSGSSNKGAGAKGAAGPSGDGPSAPRVLPTRVIQCRRERVGIRRRQGQIRPERPFQQRLFQQWCRWQRRCRAKRWRPVGSQGFCRQGVIQCRRERVGIRRRQGQIRPERPFKQRLFQQWCKCQGRCWSKR